MYNEGDLLSVQGFQGKEAVLEEASVVQESSGIRPLTEEEIAQQLHAIEQSQKFIDAMRQERGGKPLDSSAPLIRRARIERSKQLLRHNPSRPSPTA